MATVTRIPVPAIYPWKRREIPNSGDGGSAITIICRFWDAKLSSAAIKARMRVAITKDMT